MKYSIVSPDTKVLEIVGDNQIITVAGGFFGDEAKGKTTDSLAKYVEAVARVNSGENAGHTVFYQGNKLVFHLVPSGITTGKKCYIGDNCVMDPMSVMYKEIVQLDNIAYDYSNLIVGNPFIVCPWHKLIDMMRNPNASTGKGISAIHQDLAAKRFAKLEDFKQEKVRIIGIEKSFTHWMGVLYQLGYTPESMLKALESNEKVPDYVIEFLRQSSIGLDNGLSYVINLYEDVIKNPKFPKSGNPKFEMCNILRKGKKVLLEGPQSFYLSNIEGTHSGSSTSAHTHSTGILASSGLPLRYGVTQIVVTKVPSSRVGSGANPSGYVEQDWFSKRKLTGDDLRNLDLSFEHVYEEFINAIDEDGYLKDVVYKNPQGEEIEVLGSSLRVNEAMAIVSSVRYGEFGATTGKPRVCGSLDLLHLKHQTNCDSNYLSISCMDRLDGLSKIPVVVGYKYVGEDVFCKGKLYSNGDLISLNDCLPDENVLRKCIPIYMLLDGWKNCRKLSVEDNLEENLENFIEFIENNTGAQIISFGNGPESNELVYISRKRKL